MTLASVIGSVTGALFGIAWGLQSSVDELSDPNRNEAILAGVMIGLIFFPPICLLIRPLRSWLGIGVVGLSALVITCVITFIMTGRSAAV